jgi:hypothetical protein
VGTGRKLVLLALAAGLLRASDSADLIYRFRIANRAAKVEYTSAAVGNWDVQVTVDPVTCQITCSYRLKRNSPAAHLLAPPVVVVRVYSNFVSLPDAMTIDPAGLDVPSAVGKPKPSAGFLYLPGRKLLAASPPRILSALPAAAHAERPEIVSRRSDLSALTLPLRI